MSKISKKIKNANPEIYGYEHPWEIPGNTREKITVYCAPFVDADGEKRYCRCTKEFYQLHRSMESQEFKARDRSTRCWIYSEDGVPIRKCRYKCSECPFGKTERDVKFISTDYLYDEYSYEIKDDSSVSMLDAIIEEECIAEMNRLISLLKESDRIIIQLVFEGFNDTEISNKLNRPRTTICYRRKKIFDDLKRQLKDF